MPAPRPRAARPVVGLAIWMVASTIQFKWQASIGSLAMVLVVWARKPVLATKHDRGTETTEIFSHSILGGLCASVVKK